MLLQALIYNSTRTKWCSLFGLGLVILCAPEFFRVDNWAELSELMLECTDLRRGQSN